MLTVGDLLDQEVQTVGIDATLEDAEQALSRSGGDALAVVTHGRLLGVVRVEDVEAARPSAATTLERREVNGALARIRVTAIMLPVPSTVVSETPLAEAARLVQVTGGPVAVLSQERLIRLVTARDLLKILAMLA